MLDAPRFQPTYNSQRCKKVLALHGFPSNGRSRFVNGTMSTFQFRKCSTTCIKKHGTLNTMTLLFQKLIWRPGESSTQWRIVLINQRFFIVCIEGFKKWNNLAMATKQNNPNNGKFNQLLYNLCVKKTNNQFKK